MLSEPKTLTGRKYPARQHAKKVFQFFREYESSKNDKIAFFISGQDLELYSYCDQTKPFRQDRYFFYLSGVDIPGSHIIYNAGEESLTLYLPNIDYDDVLWSGMPMSLEEAQNEFEVDQVKYVSDLYQDLSQVAKKASVFTTDLNDINKKYADFLIEKRSSFFKALDESRVIKDSYEIELMRYAAKVTDKCHLGVMSAVPIEKNETHIHAEFMYHALRQGSKHQAYDPICCGGTNCSTLHYVKNDEPLAPAERSVLIDAGAEWGCYASDVTRCFPINGDWSKEHLEIYNTVLRMQLVTMLMIKPGKHWDDIHFAAHKVLIEEFLKLGIFNSNYSPEEIFVSRISAHFFPHGLGHLIGMDTHDVGGYPDYDSPDPYLRYLRLRRPLLAGMVLTDEPGVYFSPMLLEELLKNKEKMKYVCKDVLDKYWYIGGVRIEDDLLITSSGCENLTGITSNPHEISKIIKQAHAKGPGGFHNVV